MENSNKNIAHFYRPELDGLRFFAFFLVFIHHHTLFDKLPILSILHKTGWIGVDLFFVLSAFLFTKLLILEFNKTATVSYRKFFIRRIFRIWPIYFLFIVFCLGYKIVSSGVLDHAALLRTFGLFTFTDNILTVLKGYNIAIPFVAHLWTISFEEQFYLIVPLLILFLTKLNAKKRKIFFISVFLLLNVLRLFLIHKNVNSLVLWVLPFTHFESILFGIILGFHERFLPKVKPWLWLLLSVALCFAVSRFDITLVNYKSALLYLSTGLAMVLSVKSALDWPPLRTFLSTPFLVFLGKRSYGLYLYHFLGNFIGQSISSLMGGGLLLSFLLSLIVTIIISIISYSVIEKPFLKLKKKYEVVKSRPI